MKPKITPEHLRRGAIVYVRQSSIGQVLEHTESKRRQYALADSARELGFVSVAIISWSRLSVAVLLVRSSALRLLASLATGVTGTTSLISALWSTLWSSITMVFTIRG